MDTNQQFANKQINNSPPEQPVQKSHLLFIVGGFILLLLIGTGVYILGQRNKPPMQPLPTITKVDPLALEWNVPDKQPGIPWQEVTPSTAELHDSFFTYNKYSSNLKDDLSGNIQVVGKLFKATLVDKGATISPTLYNEEDVFSANGWNWRTTYNGYQIDGIDADGVYSSVKGYVKIIDHYARTIITSSQMDGFAGPGKTPKCPCDTHVTWFISDPVDLNSYIPKHQHNK